MHLSDSHQVERRKGKGRRAREIGRKKEGKKTEKEEEEVCEGLQMMCARRNKIR